MKEGECYEKTKSSTIQKRIYIMRRKSKILIGLLLILEKNLVLLAFKVYNIVIGV